MVDPNMPVGLLVIAVDALSIAPLLPITRQIEDLITSATVTLNFNPRGIADSPGGLLLPDLLH